MKYLLPSYLRQNIYITAYVFRISQIKVVLITLSSYYFRKRKFYYSLLSSFSLNIIFLIYPRPRFFKTICWFNSKSRWVFKDFCFSRGIVKKLFTYGRVSGHKIKTW